MAILGLSIHSALAAIRAEIEADGKPR